MSKIPEMSMKEMKKFYKAEIKHLQKTIRQLKNRVEELENQLLGKEKPKQEDFNLKTFKEKLVQQIREKGQQNGNNE